MKSLISLYLIPYIFIHRFKPINSNNRKALFHPTFPAHAKRPCERRLLRRRRRRRTQWESAQLAHRKRQRRNRKHPSAMHIHAVERNRVHRSSAVAVNTSPEHTRPHTVACNTHTQTYTHNTRVNDSIASRAHCLNVVLGVFD